MTRVAVLIVLLVGAGAALAIPSFGADDACGGGEAEQHLAFELQESGEQGAGEIPPANPDPTAVAGWIANQAELVPPVTPVDTPDELPDPQLFGFSTWREIAEYTLATQTAGEGVRLACSAAGVARSVVSASPGERF